MRRFRVIVERVTVERCELEVLGDSVADASTTVDRYFENPADWRRRRVSVHRAFGEVTGGSIEHEVKSTREVR